MRRPVLIALFATLAAARPAHAELWASSAGELMKAASRIEVIDVGAVKDRTIDGKLVAPIRSSGKAGDPVHVDIGYLPAPKVGDRVLIVCDSECPRAIGVETDGAYRLIAQEPGDGAFVTPNLVERRSLELLAGGKPASDLCIRGVVELLDEVARPTFEIRVRADDGKGKGKLDTRAVAASFGVVWFAGETGALSLKLASASAIELVADRVGRDKDGCYSASFLPSQPIARTRKGLGRVLDGKPVAQLIGHGQLDIPAGTPLKAGKHLIEFRVTADGYLELASDIAEGRVSRTDQKATTFGVGFPTKRGAPNDPELDFTFSVPSINGYEHGAAVAKALRQGAKATVSWTQGRKDTALGTMTFTYDPER